MCTASSDNHAQALVILWEDAAHTKREHCISPLSCLALQKGHAKDTSASGYNKLSLANESGKVLFYICIYIYEFEYFNLYVQGANAIFAQGANPAHRPARHDLGMA